jgi:hypothetical protein
METLREEILQAQRVRSELLKWKLGLVGALGGAGLGFAGTTQLRHADLVLAAIPPVCVYVDLLCRHLSLRILVIGRFAAGSADDEGSGAAFAAYERFVERARALPSTRGTRSVFALEDWALSGSSYALSAAIAAYGLYLWSAFSVPFVVSGVVGIVATWLARRLYLDRDAGIRSLGTAS